MMASFFPPAQLGAVSSLSSIASASTSAQSTSAGPMNFGSATSAYGANTQSTMMLGGIAGQSMMDISKTSEQGADDRDNQMQATEFKLWSMYASPKASTQIIRGTPLFVNSARESIVRNKPQVVCYPLWALNNVLETSARDNVAYQRTLRSQYVATPTVAHDGSHAPQTAHAHALRRLHVDAITAEHTPNYDPNTRADHTADVEGVFTHNWQYAGVFSKMYADAKRTELIMHVAVQRHAELPNFWGDVKVGWGVGFVLRWVQPGFYQSYYDEDGNEAGPPTSVPFLQITPYVVKNGTEPMAYGGHDDNDTMSTVPCVRAQTLELLSDENGLPTTATSQRPEDQELRLQYERHDQGLVIYVGRVSHTRRTPSAEMCRRALRSPDTCKLLAGEYRVDVQLGIK